MPAETGTSVRVHIPDFKDEIEIDCQPHDSFWQLKLCLVDNLPPKVHSKQPTPTQNGYLNYDSHHDYCLDLEFKQKQRLQTETTTTSSLSIGGAYAAPLRTISGGSCGSGQHGLGHASTTNPTYGRSRSCVIQTAITTTARQPPLLGRSTTTTSRAAALSVLDGEPTTLGFYEQESKNMNKSTFNRASLISSTSPSLSSRVLETKSDFSTSNMIAKLASGSAQKSSSSHLNSLSAFATASFTSTSSSLSSSQSKRKRSKLLDVLLNSNWSKRSQQTGNLMKLNKILLACDVNFLDGKLGESPLSIAISSPQINPTVGGSGSQLMTGSGGIGCPQSASLFNLQCHTTTSHNQQSLQQTSVADICQSKAPLVERILLLLVRAGALIDFRNSDGRTPLHVAAMKSNFWALKTLLDLGASTDYRDINGLTPLYYSISHKAELKVTQLLLTYDRKDPSSSCSSTEYNKSIGVTDQQGWQEVHHACKLGLDAHLDKLLYYGCDMNAKISGSGNTPLHVAAINDQLDCAKILLLRGADKTITNNSHQTAHQVAVISNNMDLAEFISEHDQSKVVPFGERSMPTINSFNGYYKTQQFTTSPSSQLVNSHSSVDFNRNFSSSQIDDRIGVAQPVKQAQLNHQKTVGFDTLMLDVSSRSATNSAPTSGTSHTTQSLLSINANSNHPPKVQMSNISPCLSQRSCATSNTTTTSSSGVCCDGDGSNSMEEIGQSREGRHPNITIISIGNNSNGHVADSTQTAENRSRASVSFRSSNGIGAGDQMSIQSASDSTTPACDEEDPESSESSGNDLYSVMSEERPLFVGTVVEASSDYQSGDSNHLQLHRGDRMEILEYPPELVQGGQLPRLLNKPLLFGKRQKDGLRGLFPSFCVRRTKQGQSSLRQLKVASDIVAANLQQHGTASNQQFSSNSNLRSSVSLQHSQSATTTEDKQENMLQDSQTSFLESQVTLNKCNDGFGFVLRGAKINPATLSAPPDGCPGKIFIDERLMAVNNLASLQYLDDIELGSVAQQAGLRRGDFLVAVNHQDVRLSSHEQVVHLIRQSGDQVHLTIAKPITTQKLETNGYSSKTLLRKKPEPPKRDPTTTLSRNKTLRVTSLIETRNQNFDANKPLPQAPAAKQSPTGSLNMIGRSVSTNLSHFQSAQSLSSGAPDTQSISSVSTIGSADQHMQSTVNSLGSHRNQSSSSTTTLTTVASTKPKAPAKPNRLHLNSNELSPNSQSAYQPAVVTTSQRNPSIAQEQNSPPQVQPATPVASKCNLDPDRGTPSLPPPPPPLPNFSETPSRAQLHLRRVSAPINQSDLSIKPDSLLKKRESLAIVAPTASNFGPNNSNSQISAVAAACAAAANNRLQRQQQLQQKSAAENSGPPQERPQRQNDHVSTESIEQAEESDRTDHKLKSTDSSETLKAADVYGTDKKLDSSPSPPQTVTKPTDAKITHSVLSSTLGRKFSAQVIHNPKQMSQSQTLRPKQRRPSIPSYEELPPPPPPLPASNEQQLEASSDLQHHRCGRRQHRVDDWQPPRADQASSELTRQQVQLQQQMIIRQQQLLQQHYRGHHVIQPLAQQSCQNDKHVLEVGQYCNGTNARGQSQLDQLALLHQQNSRVAHNRHQLQYDQQAHVGQYTHHHKNLNHHHHIHTDELAASAVLQQLQRAPDSRQVAMHIQSPHSAAMLAVNRARYPAEHSNPNNHRHHHHHHHHHHSHHQSNQLQQQQRQQQQQLYQLQQQQQFIERYLPLVNSSEPRV